MLVQLCRKNLARHGSAGEALQAATRAAGHAVEVKDCLDRCTFCERAAIALTDGAFVGAKTPEALQAQLVAHPP